jgi:predicted helicase
MITNHTYLSGLIHRGMREELIKTFSEIYILNIHGNALLGETAPDGHKDQNVFDIRQGVAIVLFVKKAVTDGKALVKYADLWGLREEKYRYLLEHDISTTDWRELEPTSPYFFYIPKDFDIMKEYEQGWRVSEIFPLNSTGFATHRDHFVTDFEEKELKKRIALFRDPANTDGRIRDQFGLRDTRDWQLSSARKALKDDGLWEDCFTRCLY